MKKILLLSAALAAIAFVSCDKLDNETPEAPDNSEAIYGGLWSAGKMWYNDYSFAFVNGVLYKTDHAMVSESEYEGRFADPYHHLSVDATLTSDAGESCYVYVVADYDDVQAGKGPVKISVTDSDDKKLLDGYETQADSLLIEYKTGKVYIEADGFMLVRNDLLNND